MSSSTLLPIPPCAPVRTAAEKTRHTPPAVTEYLLSRLRAMPFADLARLLAGLLEKMGYQDVQLMGATHGRGRNHHGGLDLQASLAGGLSRSLVIAQVKQYREPVPRAYVDELRGTMLRLGAQQALLLTTSDFAPAAVQAAQAAQRSAPVRLVDGAQLVDLLLTYGLVGASAPREENAARGAGTPPLAEAAGPALPGGAASPPLHGVGQGTGAATMPPGTALRVAVQVTFLPQAGSALPAPAPRPSPPRQPAGSRSPRP